MTAANALIPPRAEQARPACWGVDPEVFFGPEDSFEGQPVFAWEQRALAVCAHCPVATACLAEALEFPADQQHGVIGGMTAGQRKALLRTSRHQSSRSSMTERAKTRQRPRRHVVRKSPQPQEVA
jgi:WhiB family redox-sensing transcriptional regulator